MGSESDEVIELRIGEEHSLALTGLGTAGYRWEPELEAGAEVAEVLPAGGESPERADAIGASADEVFTIRANRPGAARIRFVQRRPWERSDAPPASERTIRLQVT